MDLGDLFGQPGSVEIEIGAGKGTFLINQAKAHPGTNFLGIEWANQYYQYSVDRMCRWQMQNVRMLRTDARDFIGRYIRDESVEVFHIYFPDPWPKKKHNKRRFFARNNMLEVIRCLKTGGQLRVATDHAEYFEVISQVLRVDSVVSVLFEEVEFFPTDAANEGELVGSNFERKYLIEGRKTYKIALKKR